MNFRLNTGSTAKMFRRKVAQPMGFGPAMIGRSIFYPTRRIRHSNLLSQLLLPRKFSRTANRPKTRFTDFLVLIPLMPVGKLRNASGHCRPHNGNGYETLAKILPCWKSHKPMGNNRHVRRVLQLHLLNQIPIHPLQPALPSQKETNHPPPPANKGLKPRELKKRSPHQENQVCNQIHCLIPRILPTQKALPKPPLAHPPPHHRKKCKSQLLAGRFVSKSPVRNAQS